VSVRNHAYVCSFPGLDRDPIEAGVRLRCDASWPSPRRPNGGQCTKRATTGVRYAWGASVYCTACADEECPMVGEDDRGSGK